MKKYIRRRTTIVLPMSPIELQEYVLGVSVLVFMYYLDAYSDI
tara:strand:+ start:2793 stop:2921 length:129 start_codon:yes stop_codon:yes gene_type:complete